MAVAKAYIAEGSMKARLVVLLALFFISAQFFSAAHAGAYGDQDHMHDGHPCIVASIIKKSADMDAAAAPDFIFDDLTDWVEPTLLPDAPASRPARSRAIRAPPVHA